MGRVAGLDSTLPGTNRRHDDDRDTEGNCIERRSGAGASGYPECDHSSGSRVTPRSSDHPSFRPSAASVVTVPLRALSGPCPAPTGASQPPPRAGWLETRVVRVAGLCLLHRELVVSARHRFGAGSD
jgi:hypothetical protein